VQDFGAALEDALTVAAGLSWRDDADRFLVTFGSRPPYPRRHDLDHARPCPRGLDWQGAVAALAGRDVRRVAVWRDPEWRSMSPVDAPVQVRTGLARQALGAYAEIGRSEATVERILQTLGAVFVTAETPFAYAANSSDVPETTHRRTA
jgi:hypothetical protein